jgi:hypothetical protein
MEGERADNLVVSGVVIPVHIDRIPQSFHPAIRVLLAPARRGIILLCNTPD